MTLNRRDLQRLARCQLVRRVYLYWRKDQGFSPADARMMVAAFLQVRFGDRVSAVR